MARAGLHLTVSCARCGTLFRQSRSDQRFCQKKCSVKVWRAKRKPAAETVVCACGKAFIKTNAKRVNCDDGCRSRRKRLGGPGKQWSAGKQLVPRKACQMCGRAFYAPPVQVRRGGGKFCGNSCRTSHLAKNPAMYPQTKTRRGIGGLREDLGLYLRSSWEANWARYLNWLKEHGQIRSWEYEPTTFKFGNIKRGSRFYTPDFRVTNADGSVELHEVKGYMDQKSRTKLDRMSRYYPDVKLVVIDKDSYHDMARKIGCSLPGWEGRRTAEHVKSGKALEWVERALCS